MNELAVESSNWWNSLPFETKSWLVDKYYDEIHSGVILMGASRVQEIYLLENPERQKHLKPDKQ